MPDQRLEPEVLVSLVDVSATLWAHYAVCGDWQRAGVWADLAVSFHEQGRQQPSGR